MIVVSPLIEIENIDEKSVELKVNEDHTSEE